MQNENTLKIYYDGKLDIKATYVPVLKRKAARKFDEFNDWFVALYN